MNTSGLFFLFLSFYPMHSIQYTKKCRHPGPDHNLFIFLRDWLSLRFLNFLSTTPQLLSRLGRLQALKRSSGPSFFPSQRTSQSCRVLLSFKPTSTYIRLTHPISRDFCQLRFKMFIKLIRDRVPLRSDYLI